MQGLADVVKKNYQNIALTDEWGILPIPIVTQMRINMHMFLCLCKLWKKYQPFCISEAQYFGSYLEAKLSQCAEQKP
jgi:hypothetical protein